MHVFLRNLPRYDRVRFVMRSPLFYKPISHKWVMVEEASIDLLMDAILRVINSIEEFTLDAGVVINFLHQEIIKPVAAFD